MANDATFYQNQALKRSGDVPAADWDGGMNRGGSNAPGVGVATDVAPLNDDGNWTVTDQNGAARNPQDSQHLGEGNGSPGTVPINVADAEAGDFNDTVSLTSLTTGWVRNTVA